MKVVLLTIGKTADKEIEPLIARYVDRVARFVPFEYKVLADVRLSANATHDKQKEIEGEAFLSCINGGDMVILMDERGTMPTSRQFATDLDKLMVNTRSNIIFVIGGPYGFSPAMYARANRKLALSAMTLTHEMARLFLAEQLYRAMTILRGMPYHHD